MRAFPLSPAEGAQLLARLVLRRLGELRRLGDVEGHPFRGNQYTAGHTSGLAPDGKPWMFNRQRNELWGHDTSPAISTHATEHEAIHHATRRAEAHKKGHYVQETQDGTFEVRHTPEYTSRMKPGGVHIGARGGSLRWNEARLTSGWDFLGGKGSGDFGHAGRPGEKGGSLPNTLLAKLSAVKTNPKHDAPPAFDFNSQAGQFPATGPKGIKYFKAVIPGESHVLANGKRVKSPDKYIDTLLFRGTDGKLQGVLYHYPMSFYPYENKGNVNVIVDPAHGRKGIATTLLKEADTRWDINFDQQSYTTEGRKFIEGLRKRQKALGGKGSGDFGHAGRPGERGGSSSDGGKNFLDEHASGQQLIDQAKALKQMMEGRLTGPEIEHQKALAAAQKNPLAHPPFVIGGNPDGMRYIAAYGKEYTAAPRPADLRKEADKECYKNASLLVAAHPELTYVEGFAKNASTGDLTFQHAWAVDKNDRVIDVTWRDPEKGQYFGVKYDRDKYLKYLWTAKVYGVIGGSDKNAKKAMLTGGMGMRVEEPKALGDYRGLGDAPGHPFRGNQYTAGYHVTMTDAVPSIQEKGITQFNTSNWEKASGGRYGQGEIFAFEHPGDALHWAAKTDWAQNQGRGTGKVSVVKFDAHGWKGWKQDTADPLSQVGRAGKWYKKDGTVAAKDIVGHVAITPEHTKQFKGQPERADLKLHGLAEALAALGGPGSGNFGHEGRPGEVGGSAAGVQHGTSHGDWQTRWYSFPKDGAYEASMLGSLPVKAIALPFDQEGTKAQSHHLEKLTAHMQVPPGYVKLYRVGKEGETSLAGRNAANADGLVNFIDTTNESLTGTGNTIYVYAVKFNKPLGTYQKLRGADERTLGGRGSGNHGHRGRPGQVGGSDKASRAARALASYNPSTKSKQDAAKASVAEVAELVGGMPTAARAPMDVIVERASGASRQAGIEVKTLIDRKRDEITMHPESLVRKNEWVRDNKANGHTVVIDRRGPSPTYYHQVGFGSFALNAMQRVKPSELRALVRGSRRTAMSYYLYDVNGYVADGPSIGGLESFRAAAAGNTLVMQFLDRGYAQAGELRVGLAALEASGPDEATRAALLRAAQEADELLILTDGVFSGGRQKALGGPGSGDFGHAGRPGEVGGSAPGATPLAGEEWIGKPESAYPPSFPEGRDTQERFSDKNGNYTEERQKLHDEIVARFMRDTKAVENPEALVLGGGPGSGKSTMIKAEGIGHHNTVTIDADAIREYLPEYNIHGGPNVSPFVHEEASDIAKLLMTRALAGDRNIVLDGTGDTTLQKLGGKVATMRGAGYRVTALYVTTSVAIAQARADKRTQDLLLAGRVGRTVAPTAFKEIHKAVSEIYPEAVRQGLFEHSRLYDVTNKPATLVASSHGKELTKHDERLWEIFLRKAK